MTATRQRELLLELNEILFKENVVNVRAKEIIKELVQATIDASVEEASVSK